MAIEGKYLKEQPRGWSAPVAKNQLLHTTIYQQAHSAKAQFPPLISVALCILVINWYGLDIKHAIPYKISVCLKRIESTMSIGSLSRSIIKSECNKPGWRIQKIGINLLHIVQIAHSFSV